MGTAHNRSLFEFAGFSLVDGNVCDFPTRGVAEAKNEKECTADVSAAISSGCTWLVLHPSRARGKSGA